VNLAQALRCNIFLTELDLSFNYVGEEGAGRLAESLKHNTTLTLLDLEANQVGDVGAIKLAEALECNMTLTSLRLSSTLELRRGCGEEKLKSDSAKKAGSLFCSLVCDSFVQTIKSELKEQQGWQRLCNATPISLQLAYMIMKVK